MPNESGYGAWTELYSEYRCGRSKPSMVEFLYICEYLGVTPSEFFDEGNKEPVMVRHALEGLKKLDARDLEVLIGLIDRLNEDKDQ